MTSTIKKLKEFKGIPFIKGMKSPIRAWANNDFLAQLFEEDNGFLRLTVNKTKRTPSGGWEDGITWDQLMEIKSLCGFGDKDALEVYPSNKDVVNVANMRHLFIPPHPVDFAWRSK